MDIGVGETEEIRLYAPEGIYNIEVTDGEMTTRKRGVSLTGEVIGAVNEDLMNSASPLGGARENTSTENKILSNGRILFVLIVIGGLFVLKILFSIEKRIKQK